MNEPCQRVEEFLNEATGKLPLELEAHVAECETCHERVALDWALAADLGRGVELAPSDKERLINRILGPAPARAGRRVRWPWVAVAGAAAALAAAVLIVAFLPGKPVEPTRPTALFADLLGPLPEMAPTAEAETPAKGETDASPIQSALAFLVGDWDGPLALGRTAIEAPLAVASPDSPRTKTENK